MGWSSRETRSRALVLLAARLCHLRVEEQDAPGEPVGVEDKMRIGDVLRGHEDVRPFNDINTAVVTTPNSSGRGERRRKKKGASSASPRCLLSRWLPSKQLMKCRSCEEECEEEEAADAGPEEGGGGCVSCVSSLGSTACAQPLVSGGREEEVISTSEAMASENRGGQGPVVNSEETKMKGSVHNPEQAILNIGMGASLVFLLTRSITEFNKMTELRREVEMVLQEIKDAVQRDDSSPKSAESKHNLTFCCSESWGDTEQQSNNPPIQDCLPCLKLPEAPGVADHDHNPMYKKDQNDAKHLNSQMEAELESELEFLQISLGKQDSSEQLMMESSGKRTGLSEGFSVNLHPEQGGRARKEDSTRYCHGVCPHELTRRLHELLEARQEERITELESALQLAHIKLREKEMEATWWRDTARLSTQHKQQAFLR